MIDIDPANLGDKGKVAEAIRNGHIEGESYIPNADSYEGVSGELPINRNEIIYDFTKMGLCKKDEA